MAVPHGMPEHSIHASHKQHLHQRHRDTGPAMQVT
jgi:hypothetical protein